ncbi:GTP-binding protein GEM isoform X1 [Trichogramma pretiosum]|uniref:GTP-binding protein GEM isoform X1 n=1 Tax=Trichogramma pretiosum TaxID=7493 RepID=UPI0006C99126|nr:GTP-binding protein GEM isoform X1 [Trichogramma pretiosum]
MAETSPYHNNAQIQSMRRKTRSASICAPGSQSMEQMLNNSGGGGGGCGGIPPMPAMARERDRLRKDGSSGNATPESNSTPIKKRRPAVRSQSARVSRDNKSIRKKRQEQAAQHSEYHSEAGGVRSAHCISEPRLTDNDASPGLRRRNSRRGQSVHHPHHHNRKVNAYLDVPDANGPTNAQREAELMLDEDLYRLRSFSLTSKGVINRGDSFRKKRSRSNSLAPNEAESAEQESSKNSNASKAAPPKEVMSYSVAILGARGVGKSALISQFMSSEGINAYEHVRSSDTPSEQSVFVMLNGEESELRFVDITNIKELENIAQPHAYVLMFSVIDKASFQRAEGLLSRLHEQDIRGRPVILAGNKIDLVRTRAVSSQDGKCLACTYRAKYCEISVAISHNIDELLVGILSQIRLKVAQQQNSSSAGASDSEHWYKSRGIVRASMKARQMLTWLFGKEDRKFKNCENLHVL